MCLQDAVRSAQRSAAPPEELEREGDGKAPEYGRGEPRSRPSAAPDPRRRECSESGDDHDRRVVQPARAAATCTVVRDAAHTDTDEGGALHPVAWPHPHAGRDVRHARERVDGLGEQTVVHALTVRHPGSP
jgi:hypothetical protein